MVRHWWHMPMFWRTFINEFWGKFFRWQPYWTDKFPWYLMVCRKLWCWENSSLYGYCKGNALPPWTCLVLHGSKLYLQQAGKTTTEYNSYNGWKLDQYVLFVWVFWSDGTIPICCCNVPGSVHDSIAPERVNLYQKLGIDIINVMENVLLIRYPQESIIHFRLSLLNITHLPTILKKLQRGCLQNWNRMLFSHHFQDWILISPVRFKVNTESFSKWWFYCTT